MKKVINGKRYNTETATKLAVFCADYPKEDTHYWEETLYRKLTGEFFLHGCGGWDSKYACWMPQWDGGGKLIPLTVDEAKTWVKENMDQETYDRIFGEIVDDDARRVVGFSLTGKTVEMIKRGAAERQMTLSDFVSMCVEKFMTMEEE